MSSDMESIRHCKELRAQGCSDEGLLSFLRNEGCSKVRSIAVIAEVLELPQAKAKEVVHSSNVWADVRHQDDRFHEDLAKRLKK
jgi:hypothetical protein